MLDNFLAWVDDRTGLVSGVREFLDEDIPASSGWHQVFGSVALFLLMTQFLTGLMMAINYAPQPGESYFSLRYIIEEVTAGKLMRGLHHWGATFMVIMVVLHMVQVAIWGAYKKPREATWLAGVGLLLLTLGFGLTGYLLPWDNRAYWSTVVTIQIAGLAPGGELVQKLLGSTDGTVGVATFSRFYALHTMFLPAVTAALAVFHVILVRRHGVAPTPSDANAPTKKFYPGQVFKDTVAAFVVFCLLFFMAAAIEAPLGRLADPTDTSFVPRPEWYFLFLFQLLKFFEGSLEVVGAVILPTIAILLLAAVPFLDRSKLVGVAKRVPAMGIVAVLGLIWGGLTMAALMDSPPEEQNIATAGTGAMDEPGTSWAALTPPQLMGLAAYREQNCAECHNFATGDPKSGPSLAGLELTHDAAWRAGHYRAPGQETAEPAEDALDEATVTRLNDLVGALTLENAGAIEETPAYALTAASLYEGNACGACHMTNGVGQQLGPPLNGVTQRRETDWLIGHFKDPQAFAPGTMMPAYSFSDQEMQAMIDWMTALPAQ